MRKPKPRKTPETLRELVLDLDERLDGGDESSDVWLPGTDWQSLCAAAEAEQRLAAAEPSRSPATGEIDAEFAELRETLRATKAALEQQRGALAHVLGAGVDTEFADCLQIARGYAQALDAERTPAKLEQTTARIALAKVVGWGTMNSLPDLLQVVEGYVLAVDAERQRALSAEAAAHALAAEPEPEGEEEPEAEHPECPHCGEADGHKPSDCAMNVDSDAALAADSGRRLNGAGWKRTAKAARASNSLDDCHHCGVGADDDGAGLVVSRNDDVLPDGAFCRGCRVRLQKNPAEWQRHGPPAPTMVEKLEADEKAAAAAAAAAKKGKRKDQTTLDEAIAATTPHREVHRAPGRATKKFPLGARDLAEKCTACGAELGEHAGTKCPPKKRRMLFEDAPAEVA